METKKLKPKDGQKFLQPNGRWLPEDGANVVMDSYYLRALQDGDVVEVEESPDGKPIEKPKSKKE